MHAVSSMPAEEATTPQIRKVYELLVKEHPSYDDFRIEGEWAFAHKRSDSGGTAPAPRKETEVRLVPVPWELLKQRMR